MKCDKEIMRLYAVTDRAWVGRQSLYQQVESALKGGVTCLQLREKELSDDDFLAEALEISALCKRYAVPFFINDNVDVAIACHADGIHVGQEDLAISQVRQRVGNDMMIGVSVHSVEEALMAVKHGADYLGVGAMFATSTKTDVDILPMDMLRNICEVVDIPVVAIGPAFVVVAYDVLAHYRPLLEIFWWEDIVLFDVVLNLLTQTEKRLSTHLSYGI